MKNIAFLLPLFLLLACDVEHNKPLLIGEWEMVDWYITNTNEKIQGQKMDFAFGDDDRYEVDYGTQKEVGSWRVSGNNLFTTEDGMAEKMVRITQPIGDTLVFEMNRSGRLEVVVLVKN